MQFSLWSQVPMTQWASRLIMHHFQVCFLLCILQSPFAITSSCAHGCSSQLCAAAHTLPAAIGSRDLQPINSDISMQNPHAGGSMGVSTSHVAIIALGSGSYSNPTTKWYRGFELVAYTDLFSLELPAQNLELLCNSKRSWSWECNLFTTIVFWSISAQESLRYH